MTRKWADFMDLGGKGYQERNESTDYTDDTDLWEFPWNLCNPWKIIKAAAPDWPQILLHNGR
jgi:hypothetical protein